ncbi:Conserved_hypothetical protein [Hexamita inflata]|uniref:Transmembrane protein n=1 Tax=Hexamita inflata TaxID=28002 RepID=A0AA86P1J6_9EUKA|nr:Conserved hypothetical protein [Hexamita inflata]
MIILIYVFNQNWCKNYTGIESFNPIISIYNLSQQTDAYLAFKIRYGHRNPKFYTKYIFTQATAEQSQLDIIVYDTIASVVEICSSEEDNIKYMNNVAVITDYQEINNLEIQQKYFMMIHPFYEKCMNPKFDYFELTPSVNGQLLTIYQTPENWGDVTVNFASCYKRVPIDLTPKDGIIYANNHEVLYPVYNPNLKNYGENYGNFLYPALSIYQQADNKTFFYSMPSDPLDEDDEAYISKSLLFGAHFGGENVTVFVGGPRDDEKMFGFENITIYNSCVQFYSDSPRDIEYPLNSGIIFNIRTETVYNIDDIDYTVYFGPFVCVEEFNYMPAMFYTAEDPALKQIHNNLEYINRSFEASVKNRTWKYLTSDQEANIEAIEYTRSLIKYLDTICKQAFFSRKFLRNLIITMAIITFTVIFSNVCLFTILIVRKQAKSNKRYNIIYYTTTLTTIVIILLCCFVINSFGIIFIFFVAFISIYVIIRGLKNYVIVNQEENVEENDNSNIQTENSQNKQQKTQRIITFCSQYIIWALFKVLEIIQTITDTMQMLQYLQVQYYENQVAKVQYLMYPADKMLEAAQYLAQSAAYPILLVVISLINQEIMKQDWFKNCIHSPANKLDNKTFLIKLLFLVFGYFQGFVYNVFFEFSENQLQLNSITNDQLQYNMQVIVKIILSGTIYSISKYQLVLEYYYQLNQVIIKAFTNIIQIVTNTLIILITILKIVKHILKCNFKAVYVQIQIFFISICLFINYILMLVLDPIVNVLFPTSLMFQELTGNCPFLLQVFGIVEHQDEFAKYASHLLATDTQSILNRLLASVQVGASTLFFSMLLTKNQNVSINPIYQWFSIFFGCVLFITPFVCKNMSGQLLSRQQMKLINQQNTQQNMQQSNNDNLQHQDEREYQQYKIKQFSMQNQIISLQNQLVEAQCKYHKSLLSLRGDYKHPFDYYEDYLSGFIFTGYGVIPGFGIVLSTLAKYMNATGLASDGQSIMIQTRVEKLKTLFQIFLDLMQLLLIVLGILFALRTNNKALYLSFIILYIVIFYIQMLNEQLVDVFEKNIYQYVQQVFQCFKKKKSYNKRLIKIIDNNLINKAENTIETQYTETELTHESQKSTNPENKSSNIYMAYI